jgi:hypothetical protein
MGGAEARLKRGEGEEQSRQFKGCDYLEAAQTNIHLALSNLQTSPLHSQPSLHTSTMARGVLKPDTVRQLVLLAHVRTLRYALSRSF